MSCEKAIAVSLEGDIVLVEDDKPRRLWRLGRVRSLITGNGGHPQAAVIVICLL